MNEPSKYSATFVGSSTLNMPKPTGRLFILSDFCVMSYQPKPEQKHLDAMREAFGFVWEDL